MDKLFTFGESGSGKEAFVKAARKLQNEDRQEKKVISLIITEAPALRPFHDLFPPK